MSCDTVNNINKSTTVHAHVDLLLLFSDFPTVELCVHCQYLSGIIFIYTQIISL